MNLWKANPHSKHNTSQRLISLQHLWVPVVQVTHEAAAVSAGAAATSQVLGKGASAGFYSLTWLSHGCRQTKGLSASVSLLNGFHQMLAFTMAASFLQNKRGIQDGSRSSLGKTHHRTCCALTQLLGPAHSPGKRITSTMLD